MATPQNVSGVPPDGTEPVAAGGSLRRRLFVLAAAAILPLAVTTGIGLLALRRQQEDQAERVGVELARSVGNAVDAELRRSIAVLEALATTPNLDDHDLVEFQRRAERVAEPRPEWAAMALNDADGTPLVDTRVEPGGPLPPVFEPESFERVVRTGAPAVGSLVRHVPHEWLFAVRVPVVRGGAVRYVLTALVRPEAIRAVLTRQHVPADWVVSAVDAQGRRVGRSRAHEENLGGPLSDTTQQVVSQGGTEGFGTAYSLEGDRIYAPYSRLPLSGWMVVLGIPTDAVGIEAFRSLAIYGGGVLLSLVLGTLAALWVARSIIRPTAELRAAAEALGRRQTPRPPETSILELREVGAALRGAADELERSAVERDNLLRKERRARETAEAADRAKDEFLTVLSHELRTPLNAVYGWARMLQDGQIRDEVMMARAMDAIVRNADVQVRLIDDLLDLSRITSGKMRLDVRPVEMGEVLRSALDAVRPAADVKGIRIEEALAGAAGQVIGDPARLQQVVWNLLMNAVKFTPRGGTVRLELRPVDGQIEIVVSDTGSGIAPAMLPHVFERFRQADSSSTRAHGGLGLGLALVKHLVELHGGQVAARSEGEGQGATFVVSLPVSQSAFTSTPELPPAPVAGPSPEPAGLVRLDGLRVLVVDDDRDAATLTQAILTRAGAQARACLSAAEAGRVMTEWRPDVLISDIEMPGEDGYSFVRRIRAGGAGEKNGSLPAIALTAYGRPQDRLRALVAGFNLHVAKPVDPGELTAAVARIGSRNSPPAA